MIPKIWPVSNRLIQQHLYGSNRGGAMQNQVGVACYDGTRQANIMEGQVGIWDFQGPSNVFDISGWEYHFDNRDGNKLQAVVPTPFPGMNGVYFPGNSRHCRTSCLDFHLIHNRSNLALSFWYNIPPSTGGGAILNVGQSEYSGFSFSAENDGFRMLNSSGGWSAPAAAVPVPNTWNFGVINYNGGWHTAYLNGNNSGNTWSDLTRIPNVATNSYIGWTPGGFVFGEKFFNGSLAMIRLWSRNLSYNEIKALYANPWLGLYPKDITDYAYFPIPAGNIGAHLEHGFAF